MSSHITTHPWNGQNEPAAATPKDLCTLSGMPGDAQALARLGWVLFTKVGEAQQPHDEAVGLLAELRSAARVVAVEPSPASLGLLHHVPAKHGWLPPPDATPLQALAAPPNR